MLPIVECSRCDLLEWPDHIAAVLVTSGCNLRCPICHVPRLVDPPHPPPIDDIVPFLKEVCANEWVDGIVITGGEPTIYPEGLVKLCCAIRDYSALHKLSIRLATNGTCADILRYLIRHKLIDAVVMDIKQCVEKLKDTIEGRLLSSLILESISVLSALEDVEFRTTVVYHPEGKHNLHEYDDLARIVNLLRDHGMGRRPYYLQPFRPKDCLDKQMLEQPATPTEILMMWRDDMLSRGQLPIHVRGVDAMLEDVTQRKADRNDRFSSRCEGGFE